MLENRKEYSSKQMENMIFWYLFRKDRISSGDVNLEQFPMEQMFANPFTKSVKIHKLREFKA